MIRCQDCEFFHRDPTGRISFSCDPFANIKEPECLTKWQLIKIDQMVQAYSATIDFYRRLAPMQEKMFKAMERELDDMSESESWKDDPEHEDPGPDDSPEGWKSD
jgi:hypothetical protein